jgi:CheY-like chemotaxis protein
MARAGGASWCVHVGGKPRVGAGAHAADETGRPHCGIGHQRELCAHMASPVRVLVVDDQAIIRNTTRSLLEATPDFRPVGEAGSGAEALAAVDELDPDLVLLDVRMPDMDGIETAQRIRAARRRTVVVLMSSDRIESTPMCGAAAFLPKERLRPAVLRQLWAEHAPLR